MKAILYFVANGNATQGHIHSAGVIAEKNSMRVVFRNGTVAEDTGENPEPNEGVAGEVPSTYQKFTCYGDDGKISKQGEKEPESEETAEAPKLTEDGLPIDKAALKQALTEAGVDFHPKYNIEKLTALYVSEVLGK